MSHNDDTQAAAASSSSSSKSPQHEKRIPVSFGNPALGTYGGNVYILPDEKEEGNDDEKEEEDVSIVAMMNVPPNQVPEGVLTFCRSHKPHIRHVRIVIQEELPLSSHSLEEEEEGKTKKQDRRYLILVEMSSSHHATNFVNDLHDTPYTSLEPDVRCDVRKVWKLEGKDGVLLLCPFFATTTKTTTTTGAVSGGGGGGGEVQNCAVCLEHMDFVAHPNKNSIITTVCNHTFHIDCLLRWQDSPCPVCRYDHSGLNQALSSCRVCSTTQYNMVCLICGVVSCARPPLLSTSLPPAATTTLGGTHEEEEWTQLPRSTPPPPPTTTPSTPSTRTIPPTPSGHAQQHYDETLHAYALDLETQHVWDFAGQGYVHRLIQNVHDGKLVEITDPTNTTRNERSHTPGYLTDVQEGEVVHRKLEGLASQYYTLLKSQMEQQRIHYLGKLEEIRRHHSATTTTTTPKKEKSQS
uniref:RING-type domain-containing protein n=1 Tax=Ditylum brightwellii TaxID=49249 RepID=A0A7S1YS01_9STRA|mmetsp:Transcript_15627/g.23215  ORF Transcript_15627/g.23215 Transcript_15627/m.23215 type:complete len:465 (+) Transcript_15627:114-1508(+)